MFLVILQRARKVFVLFPEAGWRASEAHQTQPNIS